ncbi:MAG: hypothetical protein A2252_08030 [Elusimicrobia bacterium RIFOXYA2_FULL_39_19]|nr:MAG: hypothetical protein A2252_08030 [Elusimicrobia bacterium RIFOXYA2_FULL_39_19]
MHETGIARDLFEKLLIEAKHNNLKKVTKVTVKLGEAGGVLEDLLRHSFIDHIFPGTIADKAKLVVIKEPLRSKCLNCGEEITADTITFDGCPKCKSKNIELVSGKDIYLESIEGDK